MALVGIQADAFGDLLASGAGLQESLGLDSLDVVELIMKVEEEFAITIPEEEAERLRTLAELVVYLLTKGDQK